MAKRYKAFYRTGSARCDLSPSICRDIGRIVVRWAYFESALRDSLAGIIKLEPHVARMAMRDPRPKDALEVIRDISDFKGILYDNDLMTMLLSKVQKVGNQRDLISHGIWAHEVTHKGRSSWHVQSTQGTWPKQTTIIDAPTGVKKRLIPMMQEMDTEQLSEIIAEIDFLIETYQALRLSFREPPAS